MDINSEAKTLILGKEYDTELIERLKALLSGDGAMCVRSSIGLGGSQVLSEAEYQVRGTKLIVEAETYIGLSIIGDESIVDWIADELGVPRNGAEIANSP